MWRYCPSFPNVISGVTYVRCWRSWIIKCASFIMPWIIYEFLFFFYLDKMIWCVENMWRSSERVWNSKLQEISYLSWNGSRDIPPGKIPTHQSPSWKIAPPSRKIPPRKFTSGIFPTVSLIVFLHSFFTKYFAIKWWWKERGCTCKSSSLLVN